MPMTAANIPKGIDPYTRALLVKTTTARAASLRRKCPRTFPPFVPGKTTTADYVDRYLSANFQREARPSSHLDLVGHASHPAPYLSAADDRVQFDVERDDVPAANDAAPALDLLAVA